MRQTNRVRPRQFGSSIFGSIISALGYRNSGDNADCMAQKRDLAEQSVADA